MRFSGHERGQIMTDNSRKYKLSFSCPIAVLGTIMDAFLSEGVTPSAVPAAEAGRYKVTATIWQESLPKITGLIAQDAEQLVIAPLQEVSAETRVLLPKAAGPQLVYDESQVRRIPTGQSGLRPKITRTAGGSSIDQTGLGRTALSVFRRQAVVHRQDVEDAFKAAGYAPSGASATISMLHKAGFVVKTGWGSWRYASPNEQEAFKEKMRKAKDHAG